MSPSPADFGCGKRYGFVPKPGTVVQVDIGSPLFETGRLILVAVTHQSASLAVLEQVNLTAEGSGALSRNLLGQAGVAECMVVSTCNRTELYLYGTAPNAGAALDALADQNGIDRAALDAGVVHKSGRDAALHLLRVAAGLESRVVGEAEILGQIRSAIAAGREAGSAGPYLTNLFRFATAAGRQAHHTADRVLTPSLPRLALDAACADGNGSIGTTLVLGSGAMARSTVEELSSRELDYVVCARRPERALALATSPEQVMAFDDLHAALERADVVVCATGARTPLLRVDDLEQVMSRRHDRSLIVVDLSLPRNVEPAARDLPGIRLLDLDDLVVDTAELQIRRREEIVGAEMRRYQAWLAGRAIGHLLSELHESVQRACQATLERTWTDADGDGAALANRARTMANKALHGPIVTVKSLMAAGDEAGAFAVLASYGIFAASADAFRDIDILLQEAS